MALPGIIHAQDASKKYSQEQIDSYKADIQNLVSFLEYSFNTLGDPKTSTRDKDVIINQSYAKIFVDAEVQIEDDLDANRETLINKDVQAYLKDIDFFFKQVSFSLNISSIDPLYKDNGELYFVVTLSRTLNGRTVDGDSISNIKERFIEINFNDRDQDLRIASIYTTKIDERDELFAWWNSMSEEWHKIIAGDAYIFDTVLLADVRWISDTMAIAEYWGQINPTQETQDEDYADSVWIDETEPRLGIISDSIVLRKGLAYRLLQRMASETEIDLHGNLNINTLTPLAKMGELQKVNISNTLIDDLSPLRNLIKMESLKCSGSPVNSIAPLQYSLSLKTLDISFTQIADVELVTNLRNLEKFVFSNTPSDSLDMLASMVNLRDLRFNNTFVSNLSPLEALTGLQIINCSGTYIQNIKPLQALTNLERIYLSNTSLRDLSPLSDHNKLQTIYIDSTRVNSLTPLSGLEELESIYCDQSGISGSKANRFMAENPNVLVVYESVALTRWWNEMSPAWKELFTTWTAVDAQPSKEQLHQVAQITEIDISGRKDITSLSPLKALAYLTSLDCSNTGIDNLWALADLVDLQSLNCSGTAVDNCDPLRDLISLDKLNISNTDITDLQCISRNKHLKELNIENTEISSIHVFGKCDLALVYADGSAIALDQLLAFKQENPDATVIYQTAILQEWWNGLNSGWKDIFSRATGLKKSPDPEELQQISDLDELDLDQRKGLSGLEPIHKLYRLKSLKMNDTQIADLLPLASMHSLETLIISDNPVEDISPLEGLSKLVQLEFENTPVDDLSVLTGLVHLEILNMAGTQIKKMSEVSSLTKLRQISFYNTGIKSLSPLDGLAGLEEVKCYNTKLNSKKVSKFGESHPACELIFY